MTEFPVRLFSSDAAVAHVGAGLLARNLTRPEWTHEAHLAACTWLIRERPEINAEAELPGIISAFNVSVGGVNDATQGYHETITQAYIRAVRAHLAERPAAEGLTESVNALLLSERGSRDWPLRFYSRERLFSVEARLEFVEPDLAPLP